MNRYLLHTPLARRAGSWMPPLAGLVHHSCAIRLPNTHTIRCCTVTTRRRGSWVWSWKEIAMSGSSPGRLLRWRPTRFPFEPFLWLTSEDKIAGWGGLCPDRAAVGNRQVSAGWPGSRMSEAWSRPSPISSAGAARASAPPARRTCACATRCSNTFSGPGRRISSAWASTAWCACRSTWRCIGRTASNFPIRFGKAIASPPSPCRTAAVGSGSYPAGTMTKGRCWRRWSWKSVPGIRT